ncbi:MAG: DUF4129 domain-containing protein [Prevotella sp.]|nr:DUF4129 domain-containing protein [Prevotella sp.]
MSTLPSDSLVCDTASLVRWQGDEAYNYGRELVAPDMNMMQWILEQIERFLDRISNDMLGNPDSRLLLAIAGGVLIVAVLYLLYRYKPALFGRTGKSVLPHSTGEDTIYGIDFEAEIARAMARKDYKEAVRMVYLQTLRRLSDDGMINWQIYKTPSQYKKEVPSSAFSRFTDDFIRVRYGNFEADAALVEGMQTLQSEIGKGGNA